MLCMCFWLKYIHWVIKIVEIELIKRIRRDVHIKPEQLTVLEPHAMSKFEEKT